MGKKITQKNNTITKLISVITLLLTTTIAHPQTATELITMPQQPQIEVPQEIKKKQQKNSNPQATLKQPSSNPQATKQTQSTQPKTGKQTLIYLEQSNLVQFDNDNLPNIQVLTGNVILRHDDIYLYCDSAHLNQNTNSFQAFKNVKIQQGDSLTIHSNLLNYNGNTRIAHLYHNVKLIHHEVTLYTDTLTYNRNKDLGYYTCGGKLIDSQNTLTSQHGYYHSNTKTAEFNHNVIGKNTNSTLTSDTLTYNTQTKIATILGPTTIQHTDSTTIYAEQGWYNTTTDQSQLLKNPIINHQNGKTLQGDTIYYNKQTGIGQAYHNITLKDTINKISLHGHYAYHKEQGEISIITDSALMIQYTQNDTTYIHSDTIYTYTQNPNNKTTIAYHNVRLYNKQYQSVCDSLTYSTTDSIIHLMQIPIIWNQDQQITGDTIHIHTHNQDIDKMHIIGNAIMIQQHDTTHYNQVSGKEIIAHIQNQQLNHVNISGNVESIFYPTDQDQIIGLNSIKSTYMTIHFNQGKLDRFIVYPSPTATMHPISQITPNMLYLPNYTWQNNIRPTSKNDIFRHPQRLTQEQINTQRQEIKQQEQQERKNKRKQKNQENLQNETNTTPPQQ